MGRITDAIKHLLIINILFFVAANLYPDRMYGLFSLWFPANENFEWWQLVSHMFMHGGFMHILFNMYALWAFGSLAPRWNRCGAGTSSCSSIFQWALGQHSYIPG